MIFWVRKTEDNFKKLLKSFSIFGLPLDAFALSEFMNEDEQDVFTFGRPPVAIDIITKIKGLEFEETFKSSEFVDVSGIHVRLISLQKLIEAKKAAGRYKDLDDLDHLKIN